MRKIIALAFFITTLNYFGLTQNKEYFDSLVYFNEVSYHSELEEEAFEEFFNKTQGNYIKLFLAKEENVTKEDYLYNLENLTQYVKTLKDDKNYFKPEKKKVKYYFKTIHNKYLVKYEQNIFFPQIFKSGYYNCVTGSILYGLIFSELNIPFNVKVSPIHTYVVAYPNTESIIIETTVPIKGYFALNQSFKESYVKHLRDNKLISVQEFNTNSTDFLFDKYYFKEKNITLKEMVGIQYYNDAIEKIQNQNLEEAFYELEKAYLFYPSKEIEYLLYYCAIFVIDRQDFSDLKYVDFLYKIARYKKYGINQEQIVGEFSKITQNQLGYKGQYELYDSIYSKLNKNLEDSVTKSEISFIYNYEIAKLYVRNERLEKALPYIESALKIRPEHIDIQTLFVYTLSDKYRTQNLSEEILSELNQYGERFPQLKDNKPFINMICDAYLFYSIQNYEMGNLVEAQKYHKEFEKIIVDKKIYSDYDFNVARLYSSKAVYYFKRGFTKKSKSVILEGLKLVPNSYELKQRFKAFN